MKQIKTKTTHKKTPTDNTKMDLASRMKQGLVRTKDQIQNLSDDGQVTPDEYAEDKIKYAAEDIASDTAHASKDAAKSTYDGGKNLVRRIKQRRHDSTDIKQTAKSTGKSTIKTVDRKIKKTEKAAHNSAKTAENTGRAAIKTSEKTAAKAGQTAKAAKKSAQASAKAAKKAFQKSKEAAKRAKRTAKAIIKATVKAVKAVAAGIKSLVAAIAAGGWVAVVIIVLITVIGLIVGSCFGLFYSFGDSGNGMTIQTAIEEINNEYQSKIEKTKKSSSYDILEIRGEKVNWQEVLAVYAVKTTTDPNNAQEVATMDNSKKELLKKVFWDMHEVTKSTETKKIKIYTEKADASGNIKVTDKEESKKFLYITVKHKSADDMKSKYGFSNSQKEQLEELMSEEHQSLWSNLINVSDNDIVDKAVTQLGNSGGKTYWSWYGFSSKVEWSGCFVSWCADQCGYIGKGVIPKFASVEIGEKWFKDRGYWQSGSYVPSPGDIVFFDRKSNGYTGKPDQVGIVEKIIEDKIFVIEGNSDNKCVEKTYTVGEKQLLGYGTPKY